MKTTLDLPDDLMREVKLRAVIQGRTVKDLVAEFLRQGLGLPQPGSAKHGVASPRVQIGSDGLPVIKCALPAPAAGMPLKDLLQLEQQSQLEEDAQRAGQPL